MISLVLEVRSVRCSWAYGCYCLLSLRRPTATLLSVSQEFVAIAAAAGCFPLVFAVFLGVQVHALSEPAWSGDAACSSSTTTSSDISSSRSYSCCRRSGSCDASLAHCCPKQSSVPDMGQTAANLDFI